jgi:hypothetical protein
VSVVTFSIQLRKNLTGGAAAGAEMRADSVSGGFFEQRIGR